MAKDPDMRFSLEALVKSIWGTDAETSTHHRKSERMLAEAEAKVDRLSKVLDDSPARNLDEALSQMTQRDRE